MNILSAKVSHRSFYAQISLLCFVLGLLLAAAWNSAGQLNRSGFTSGRVGFHYGSGQPVSTDKVQQYEGEITKLRERNTDLENKLAKGKDAAGAINKDLQDTKLIAGLTDVTGPGVTVTLMDSAKRAPDSSELSRLSLLIHDEDIDRVVNELKAAGAEAVAVNGQRLVASSAIRCVGPVVQVNGVASAPPVIIQAIGNPDTLYAALNLRDGVLDMMRRFDPNMCALKKEKQLHLPEFAGSTATRYAKPAKSSPKEAAR